MGKTAAWLLAFGTMFLSISIGFWIAGTYSNSITYSGISGVALILIALVAEYLGVRREKNERLVVDRAYVHVNDASVSHPNGAAPTMVVSVKNSGRSPARELTWRAKFTTKLLTEADMVTLDPNVPPGPKQTLAPGNVLSFKYTFSDWNSEIDAMLEAGTAAIFAIGEVRYKDIAGVVRSTSYLLMSGGRFNMRPGISGGRFGTVREASN